MEEQKQGSSSVAVVILIAVALLTIGMMAVYAGSCGSPRATVIPADTNPMSVISRTRLT